MDRIVKENLIHPARCFQRDELERRRVQHKFVHLAKVEAFAWDLELYGQLQSQFNNRVILKGGAAAQLFFPIHLQRNSVDIDVVTDLTNKEFAEGLKAVTQRLCPNGAVCTFKEYIPERGKDGLRLTRYTIEVPSVCNAQEGYGRKDPTVQTLNVDVLYGTVPKEHFIEKSTQTFALDLEFAARVCSTDALFGDKLMTLAVTTVGIPDFRASDRCKQLYDLHGLVSLGLLQDAVQIQESFKLVMETQNQIRGQESISLADAVVDVETFLERARHLDFLDPLGLWRALQGFQSNFVGVDARMPRETWVIGIEKIRLIVEGLILQQKGSAVEPLELLNRAQKVESGLNGLNREGEDAEVKREHIKKLQEKLIGFCQTHEVKPGPLRGRSPRRIFWYLARQQNLEELEKLILN